MSRRLIDLIRPGANPDEPLGGMTTVARRDLHRDLVASLDFTTLSRTAPDELRAVLRGRLLAMVEERRIPMTSDERSATVEAILDEALGLGPLERLLHMPGVTDILVNGPDTVYVEVGGKLQLSEVRFQDEEHLRHIITRVVAGVGRRIDESTPMVDARLPDGSRVNAVIPPIALKGAAMSIRRFPANPLQASDLVRLGSIPEPLLALLLACVRAKMNILVSGGTGSGKTTLLNALSSAIPAEERIVTIEDAAELRLQQRHVVGLETRPPNLEGHGEITARDLVRNALRMRPDRVIIGEIRSDEALDMLQAMNTGHEGSLGTIHANGPRHALQRLQTMVGLALNNVPTTAIREMISGALHLVVQVQRGVDGRRRITGVEEVLAMEGEAITSRSVFTFEQRTVDTSGQVRGAFVMSSDAPAFFDRFRALGIPVPEALLGTRVEV